MDEATNSNLEVEPGRHSGAEESESNPVDAKKKVPWKGICYDDGTGRNVYFVGEDGSVSILQSYSCDLKNFICIFSP